jgi:CO dehydrogenase/acetyl-CoA synthase beta subunit
MYCIINKNKNHPIFSSLKKEEEEEEEEEAEKYDQKPNVSILREKNEENEGEEGGYFNSMKDENKNDE